LLYKTAISLRLRPFFDLSRGLYFFKNLRRSRFYHTHIRKEKPKIGEKYLKFKRKEEKSYNP
jgi:hypothetical protein